MAHTGACAARSDSSFYGCRCLILLLELLLMMAPLRLRQLQPPLNMASGNDGRPANIVAHAQLLYQQFDLVLLKLDISMGTHSYTHNDHYHNTFASFQNCCSTA